ncbi:hypothetical protein ACVXHB_09225 [Escherichia coli]
MVPSRRNVVLSRMLDEGYITQQQFDQTRTRRLTLTITRRRLLSLRRT